MLQLEALQDMTNAIGLVQADYTGGEMWKEERTKQVLGVRFLREGSE